MRNSLLALALLGLRIAPVSAQAPDTIARDTAAVVQQGQPQQLVLPRGLFDRSDAYLAAGFAAATLSLFPVDRHFAEEMQSSSAQSNATLGRTASTFEKLPSAAYGISGGMYLVGKLAGRRSIADVGLHATESLLLAEGIGSVLKRAVGRARPYVSNTADPRDFSFGTGFDTGDRRSLPSGHTYTAFALASAITSETREWWPGSTRFVAPLMYGSAMMVGLSRMYHNQHWASDIVLGAAVGTFSGLKLVRYMHAHSDNRGNRLLLGSPVVRRSHDETQVGWQVQF
jgi:membrane-associated phospholipid phosphatase